VGYFTDLAAIPGRHFGNPLNFGDAFFGKPLFRVHILWKAPPMLDQI
jgi:hypothetical protein